MAPDLLDGAPAGSVGGCHPSGWIQTHIIHEVVSAFYKFHKTKQYKDYPIILILYGHYTHTHTHTRNIDVIDLGRENNLTIICLSPHCTHAMKSLI